MVEGGKVSYNGKRVKPSKLVEIGAEITLQQGNDKITVVVQELSNKRTAYKIAKNYYQETAESISQREHNAEMRKFEREGYTAPHTKPNKKDRRKLSQFKIDRSLLDLD